METEEKEEDEYVEELGFSSTVKLPSLPAGDDIQNAIKADLDRMSSRFRSFAPK